MAMLLQRICWNSLGWREPTGELSGREESYVGNNGFGHEEWNFNSNDLIDGFVHGYTYYPALKQHPSIGYGPHEICFFAISPRKERLIVGSYSNAHFLNPQEIDALKSQYFSSDISERRIEELTALNLDSIRGDAAARKKLEADFALNVRVRPADVHPYNPHRLLTSEDVAGRNPLRLNRYTRPVFLDNLPVGVRPEHGSDHELLEDSYLRFTKSERKVIERRHNQISNRFRSWLCRAGAERIVTEKHAVDVRCVFRNESYLFELKTVYRQSTRHALRDALGQLLEYSCYPGRSRPDHFAIVLDAPPGVVELQWLHNIKALGIDVEAFWLQGDDVACARLVAAPLALKALLPSGDAADAVSDRAGQ